MVEARSPERSRAARPRARGNATARPRTAAGGAPATATWERALPAVAVLVAFALRAWALQFQPWVTTDGTEYIRFADALSHGHAFSSIFPPGYPALIAFAHLFVPDRVHAAGWVGVVCGALLPWPVYAIARRAVGSRWGALAALVVAVHPGLIGYSVVTLSESAYLLALWTALAWAAAALPFPAGLATGAAFAVRPEALLPAAALAVRELWRRPRNGWPRRLALLLAGFLVCAAPCWAWFRYTRGEWTVTPKIAALPDLTSTRWRELESRLGPHAGGVYGPGQMLRDLPGTIARVPRSALVHARSVVHLWPLPLLILSLAGFVRRRGIESLALLHLAALPLLGLSGQPRFVLSVLPTLAILAVTAVAWPRQPLLRWGAIALLLVGLVMAWSQLREEVEYSFEGYLGADQEAGEWLGSHSDPGDLVMDRKPFIAFYADRAYRVTPDLPVDSLIAAAQQARMRYLVVDEGVSRVFRRQLLPLLYDRPFRERHDRLEAVYIGGSYRGFSLVVFHVLMPDEPRSGRPPVNALHLRETPRDLLNPVQRGLTPAPVR